MAKQRLSETDIRKQIQDYLRWQGWFVYYNLQGLGSYPGLSDLVAVKNGRVVHIEIKKSTGRQSDKQKKFQKDLERAGGEYLIARKTEDLEVLEEGMSLFQGQQRK